MRSARRKDHLGLWARPVVIGAVAVLVPGVGEGVVRIRVRRSAPVERDGQGWLTGLGRGIDDSRRRGVRGVVVDPYERARASEVVEVASGAGPRSTGFPTPVARPVANVSTAGHRAARSAALGMNRIQPRSSP